jgi:hypothetical protein
MNTERNINKKATIAVAIVATISVLFVAPSALTSPVFALGHWHEGDDMNRSGGEEEDNNDVGADNSESQVNQKELVSCLADTKEGNTATQDEIKDCLNTIGEEDTEDDGGSDSDAISGSDEDPENSNALNSISKGSSNIEDTEDSTESDGNDE